jgi:hypothetical protein
VNCYCFDWGVPWSEAGAALRELAALQKMVPLPGVMHPREMECRGKPLAPVGVNWLQKAGSQLAIAWLLGVALLPVDGSLNC